MIKLKSEALRDFCEHCRNPLVEGECRFRCAEVIKHYKPDVTIHYPRLKEIFLIESKPEETFSLLYDEATNIFITWAYWPEYHIKGLLNGYKEYIKNGGILYYYEKIQRIQMEIPKFEYNPEKAEKRTTSSLLKAFRASSGTDTIEKLYKPFSDRFRELHKQSLDYKLAPKNTKYKQHKVGRFIRADVYKTMRPPEGRPDRQYITLTGVFNEKLDWMKLDLMLPLIQKTVGLGLDFYDGEVTIEGGLDE